MPTLEARPIVAKALLEIIQDEAGGKATSLRKGDAEGASPAASIADEAIDDTAPRSRRRVHDLNDADEGCGTVHHRRGAPHYFYAVYIVEADALYRGVEGSAPGDAVHHQQECVELLQTPELDHRTGRTVVGTRGNLDPRHRSQGLAKRGGTPGAEVVAGHDRHGRRNLIGRFGNPRGRDLDVLTAPRSG